MYKGYNLKLDEYKFESIISKHKCDLTLRSVALMYEQINNHKLEGLRDPMGTEPFGEIDFGLMILIL